ncbi:MAG: hypothetical protein ACLTAM_04420 [Collinsella sp.]
MAFEIVDGMTGTKHISSDDLSALNIATVGKADCVLGYGDNFELTMQSANSATLGTGVGMVGGKRFWNQAATNLTVQSGSQGQKRNDLVVARYAKTSAGIESITPVVVKGTPSTGTAADPATTSNDLKLWRIPLDGISVGTPVRLFDPVASLATLGDSVSQAVVTAPANGVTCVSIGRIVIVQLKNISLTGNTSRIVCQLPFKPVTETFGCLNVNSASGYVKIDTNGVVFCFSTTSGNFSGQAVICT